MLGEGGVMDAGSELINSTCYLAACELRDGASVIDAVIAPKVASKDFEFDSKQFTAVFGRRSSVGGASSLMPSVNSNTGERISIGDDVKINNVDLSGFSALKLERNVSLNNVGIVFTPMTHSMMRFEVLEAASVQNIRTPLLAGELNASTDTEYVISVSPNRQLDFKNGRICEDQQQWVLIQRSVSVDTEDALRGECRTGFN
jgi:hypothetical protein